MAKESVGGLRARQARVLDVAELARVPRDGPLSGSLANLRFAGDFRYSERGASASRWVGIATKPKKSLIC